MKLILHYMKRYKVLVVNGNLAGFAVAGGVTALHTDGIAIHTTYSFTGFVHIAQFPAGVLQPPAGN